MASRKLTKAEVIDMRRMHADGISISRIREQFGRSRETIRLAVSGETFKDVTGALPVTAAKKCGPKYRPQSTPSKPRGYRESELAWARLYQGRDAQADWILLMHEEGRLMVASV